jgi:tetratricopeptide (TPR) repeat protein
MHKYISILLLLVSNKCNSQLDKPITFEEKNKNQEAIIDKYVVNCAKTYSYERELVEWQKCLDTGLEEDSTVAYLWQQKAMPYFKAGKYEVGMAYLDKAVFYDEERWLSYRAFIKCIFAKTYREALIDFDRAIKIEGNSYVMDHTYNFHRALCYLQLNEFEKAEAIFDEDIKDQVKRLGEAHFIDSFYYGLSKYEQGKWEEAIRAFDKTLKPYPTFAEVLYYKALCLARLNRFEEADLAWSDAVKNGALGNTFNESNSIYEKYPYQVRW